MYTNLQQLTNLESAHVIDNCVGHAHARKIKLCVEIINRGLNYEDSYFSINYQKKLVNLRLLN